MATPKLSGPLPMKASILVIVMPCYLIYLARGITQTKEHKASRHTVIAFTVLASMEKEEVQMT